MKPYVFLSHNSGDAEILFRLKEMLVEKTRETVDFFLSSDHRSIKAGLNWVEQIFLALSKSSLLFTFLSPRSISSQWIFFEAGLAHGREIRVIPVGIMGVNIGEVPAPMGLLQGFNIKSVADLNHMIQIINDAFGYSFPLNFTHRDLDWFENGATKVEISLADGTHDFRVFTATAGGETPHELLKIELADVRMRVEFTKSWESIGILNEGRFVGRFKFFRGSTPNDVGLHDFTWNGSEFRGSAKLDSGRWNIEGIIWRPEAPSKEAV